MTGTDQGPDMGGLKRFSRTVDRQLTEFFVGREAEIDFITNRVRHVARKQREQDCWLEGGCTVLITGIPGAGKTALMRRLQQQWSGPKGNGPIGIAIDLEDLESRDRLAHAVMRWFQGPLTDPGRSILSSISLAVGDLDSEPDIGCNGASPQCPVRPIVLFIDEIQSMPDSKEAPEVRALRNLHLGSRGAPVLAVLAGLAHAKDVLADVEILSPGSGTVIPLGPLSPEEAAESARRFLGAFRVGGNRMFWPETIANWSDGWPMHVHNGLRSLAKELAANGGDLDRIDPFAVKRQALAIRTGYYRDRTHGVFGAHQELLARVMEEIRDTGNSESELLGLLTSHGGDRPAGMASKDAFRALLSRGLIQRLPVEDEDVYACPIPSMVSYCAAGTGNRLHRAVMGGNRIRVAALLKDGFDPNGRDIRGRTPLHTAAEQYWPNLMRDLVRAGADPQAQDHRGRTPAEVQRRDPIPAPARPLPTPAATEPPKPAPEPPRPAPKPPKPSPVDDGPDFGM